MIEYRGLSKSFDDVMVLDGVDLVVGEGETFVLLGPSGGGKSVLLKHAIGLLTPDHGDVIVDGVSIPKASRTQLKTVRRSVGYVFQNAALFDSMTVAGNLALALDPEDKPRPMAAARTEAVELLRRVNLDAGLVLDRYPAELSGGMRKRVGVARAIASRPRYVLYDEPTTGLDPVNAQTIDALIQELAAELGVTSIVVTHDLESAFQVADRVALLSEGKLRACGTPAQLLESEDPVVRQFMHRRFGTAAA